MKMIMLAAVSLSFISSAFAYAADTARTAAMKANGVQAGGISRCLTRRTCPKQ